MDKITVENVSRSFDGGRTFAVKRASLSVASGEVLALLGESGSGKTTLLKTLNRLVEPDEGTVRIDGQDVSGIDPVRLRRGIGYVFQGVGLFPHMTVAQNIAIVPGLLGWSAERTARRIDELLELVGLDPSCYRERPSGRLSGGEKQRVGFARALAARPSLLLLDEPFGALDPITRERLQGDFKRIVEDLELTAVLVTHDMTEALFLAERIAVMRSARIVQVGTPAEILNHPAGDHVASLFSIPKRRAAAVERLLRDEQGGARDPR